MKNVSDITVGNVSRGFPRASVGWKTPEARFHVWINTDTMVIESDVGRAGKPILFKNSLAERKTPGHFECRYLDASIAKNAEVIAYVFGMVNTDGMIAKAFAKVEAEEAARTAKYRAEAQEQRVKEAGPRLLVTLKKLADSWDGVDDAAYAEARALIAELELKP